MVGLMDCNNFFVSCERLFRPDLLGKPVLVLSSNDGCVVARSQEVKDMGIAMGVPYFQIKDICRKEHIHIFSSHFSLYLDISSRVMSILKEQFDTCEVYSVDEAFFTISDGIEMSFIKKVRESIISRTGIPVSFGIGKTKTIAKVASRYAKRGDGVDALVGTSWQDVTREVTCGMVWGIGRATVEKLSRLGINTVADLLHMPRSVLGSTLGVVGERLWYELSEIPVYDVGEGLDGEPHEHMTSSRSFTQKTHDPATLLSALGHHIEHLGARLRKERLCAREIVVLCAPSRFDAVVRGEYTHRIVLDEPTNDTFVLVRAMRQGFESLYDPDVPYKKAGVSFGGMVPETYITQSVFKTHIKSDRNVLNTTIDELNRRFGRGTVSTALTHGTRSWHEAHEYLSPNYTTEWDDIRRIKAM